MNDLNLLISKEQIENRISELSKQINNDYKNEKLFCICVLKGAVFFFTDILKCFERDILFEFIEASSYGSGTKSSKKVTIYNFEVLLKYTALQKYHVLIFEDIVDTGYTIFHLINQLLSINPLTIQVCTLLNKQSRRLLPIKPKYVGFEIEDKFVVGYGLDFDEQYRSLKDIYYLEEENNK